MRALVVTPGASRSERVIDVPDPEPRADEALVRGVRLGLCGTDNEIDEGLYGTAPAGSPYLVIGHESLGRIEKGAGDLAAGTHVVAMVRRPDGCPNCQRGQPDMCLWGGYEERGISRRHGFGSERWTESARYLVPVPNELVDVAVLLEPTTVAEKAIRQAYETQRRMYWEPARALVAGAGPVGILAALLLRLRGLDVLVFERSEKPERKALLATAGIGYAATSEMPLSEVAASFGRVDLAVEATGSAQVAFDLMTAIGANGVEVLTSVTGGDATAVVPIARLNREMVLGNRVVLGSVNANRLDFERGVRDLQDVERRYRGLLGTLITKRVPLAGAAAAVAHDPAQIKVVVELE